MKASVHYDNGIMFTLEAENTAEEVILMAASVNKAQVSAIEGATGSGLFIEIHVEGCE